MGDFMKNYNKILRSKFDNILDDIIVNKMCSQEKAIKIFMDWFYSINEKSNPYQKILKKYFEAIFFLDAYKLFSYKQKRNINVDMDKDLFSRLYNLEDFIDITTEFSADPDFLYRVIKETCEFIKIDELGKVNVIYSLSDMENEKLQEIIPQHEQDLYTYKREYTIEDIISHYKEENKYYFLVMSIEFRKGVVMEIEGFIIDLLRYDRANAKKLCLGIAKEDYLASKFLKDYIANDLINSHIKFYEENDVSSIIKKMLNDQDFLNEAIEMFMALNVVYEYETISLDRDMIMREENEVVKKLTFN